MGAIQFLDLRHLPKGQFGELLFPRSLGKPTTVLPQNCEEGAECSLRHIEHRLDTCPELVIILQVACFVRKIVFDRLADAGVQEFRVRGRVEEAIEITGIVQDRDIAFVGCFPI